MAVLVASSLLLPSSPLAVPCRVHFSPSAGQHADCRTHLLPCRSLPLPAVHLHGPSSGPTTTHILGTYAILASKLALSGRLLEFITIVESFLTSEAITSAESAGFLACIETKMVSGGIATVITEGKLVDALDFLDRASRFGIRPLSLLEGSAIMALKAESYRLMHHGCLEEFFRLMEVLAGYGLFLEDISDPADTIKFFVEIQKPEMAVSYASLFPQFRHLVCSIIKEFGKKKDKYCAMRAYEAFSKKYDDMYVCQSLIDVFGICGDVLQSRQMLEGLLAKNITPNIFFFNSLMNVNSHDLSYTLNVYSQLQTLGIAADMSSYNILLKACHKAKRVDLAQKIYKEAKQVALDGVFKLDIITYSTMMKVFADAEMLEMTFKIKDEMIEAGLIPNVVTWSILISACANASLIDKAVKMFQDMLMAGCEPNAHCYNSLLYACVESCQYDKAFRFFLTWKATGFEVNLDRGRKIVVPFKPTVATFNILMKACGTDHFRAKALVKEMKMMGLSPNHISWSIIIDIYGNSYDMKGALQAFRAMRASGIKLDVVAYTVAIKACVQNGNPRVAFSLFEEMKRYRLKPNLVTYRTLLKARTQYGSLCEVQQCIAVYQDMRKAGYSSNDYYLEELVEEWCEGVICCNSQNKSLYSMENRFNLKTSEKQSYLLEKVATFLQREMNDNQAIDIRGLTKVEARIVVLSVLRMIKENYQQGKTIKDDITIILGVGDQSTCSSSARHGVQHAITQVLRYELGLHVVAGHRPDESVSAAVERFPVDSYRARRPQGSGFLKVSKESIYRWLERKEDASVRNFTFLGRHRISPSFIIDPW